MSVVENRCEKATNILRVTYNPLKEGEGKKKFAVCVKGLDFPNEDLSLHLMEWVEMLNILGADKVCLLLPGGAKRPMKCLRLETHLIHNLISKFKGYFRFFSFSNSF